MHVVTEALLGDLRPFPHRDCIRQVPRDATDVGGRVSAPAIRIAECEFVANAVQPTGDLSGEGEVAVGVAARNAALDAGAAAVADLPEAERAVVDTPPDPGRGPRPGLESLVAVDRRRPQQAELLRCGDQSGEVVLERLAHSMGAVVVVEERLLAVERPQAGVHVT